MALAGWVGSPHPRAVSQLLFYPVLGQPCTQSSWAARSSLAAVLQWALAAGTAGSCPDGAERMGARAGAGRGAASLPPAAGWALPQAALACIVLSLKVKKPAKKQPSELSRKPNQKEKRGRAEEKPRNKSASPLPAHGALLLWGQGCSSAAAPAPLRARGVGMGSWWSWLCQQHPRRASSSPPLLSGAEGADGGVWGGRRTRLSIPAALRHTGEDPGGIPGRLSFGLCLSAVPGSWGVGELLSRSWEMCVGDKCESMGGARPGSAARLAALGSGGRAGPCCHLSR